MQPPIHAQDVSQSSLGQQHKGYVDATASEVVSNIRVTARTAYVASHKGAQQAAGMCKCVLKLSNTHNLGYPGVCFFLSMHFHVLLCVC